MDALTNIGAAEQAVERLLERNPELNPALISAFLSLAEALDNDPRADTFREYRQYLALLEAEAASAVRSDADDLLSSLTEPE